MKHRLVALTANHASVPVHHITRLGLGLEGRAMEAWAGLAEHRAVVAADHPPWAEEALDHPEEAALP